MSMNVPACRASMVVLALTLWMPMSANVQWASLGVAVNQVRAWMLLKIICLLLHHEVGRHLRTYIRFYLQSHLSCICIQTHLHTIFFVSDVDECASSPCKNGGVCLDGVNSYQCFCTNQNWVGPTCEIGEGKPNNEQVRYNFQSSIHVSLNLDSIDV